MKKIVKILGVTLCSLILIGCGGKKDDSRVMEEAKIAFASKEYEKADSNYDAGFRLCHWDVCAKDCL